MNKKTNIPKGTESQNEVLIRVQGLSKKFCKDFKTSLWYGVKDLANGMLGRGYETGLRPKEFWAVKDVSFELRRGECLGLIGHNGAGKSTLLKLLNGLIYPDGGQIDITGRVGALIELGAGFNPILSGRENIYNNGAILGFSRQEIDSKLDDIIAFAELEEFIDMPVQHYSSGMKVRLGFAVAAQMEPDVLLIDEVLAVGDIGFILKCFKTIDQLLPKTAIVFVSHTMTMVSRICNSIILMGKGEMKFSGKDVSKGIDLYYNSFNDKTRNIIFDDGSLKLSSFKVYSSSGEAEIEWNSDLNFEIVFENLKLDKIPFIKVFIYDKEERPIALIPNDSIFKTESMGKRLNVRLKIQNIQLTKGKYSIALEVHKDENLNPIYRENNLEYFNITSDRDYWPPFCLDAYWSIIDLE